MCSKGRYTWRAEGLGALKDEGGIHWTGFSFEALKSDWMHRIFLSPPPVP